MLMKKIVYSLLILIMIQSCSKPEKVDLLVVNGLIYTADSAFSVASEMAVAHGKIVAVGEGLSNRFIATETLDAGGKTILPGLIDAHCHFTGLGDGLIRWADLTETRSWQEVLDRITTFSQKHPHPWLLGRGWDQNDWPTKSFPDKQRLDSLFGTTPVALTRIDGHAMIANSAALKLAGIGASTRVDGGEIRLKGGNPTGLLLDNAMELVYNAIPPLSDKQRCEGLRAAREKCLAAGLTAVADAGLNYHEIHRIDSLQRAGKLELRVNAWLNPNDENLQRLIAQGPVITPHLQITAIKLYADGALGSRGALLLEPYSDDKGNRGIATANQQYFEKWADIAYDNHFQLCVHAIGDSANRLILGVFGRKLKEKNDRRWRIEHAQVVAPDDFSLFGQFSIIPSMQPTHATSDMYWAGDRLGDRIVNAYALRRLMEQNGWIPLGTDFPIENINPFYTFYAAVARKDLSGYPENGFQANDALTRHDALLGMTRWAAKSLFTESINGSLEPGKAADFIIIDRNIMKIEEQQIPETRVLSTYIDGKLVFAE